MSNRKIDITRRKVLGALGAVGAAGLGAGFGTSALFGDTEEFVGNTLAAGNLDLLVDWQQTYDGAGDPMYVNAHPDHDGDGRQSVLHPTEEYAVEYTERNLVEYLTCDTPAFDDDYDFDGAGEQGSLVELTDVKPGDSGEITFSLHLCDNPGYIWMQGAEVSNSERGYTEPEPTSSEDGDIDPDDPDGRGELAENIEVEMWYDRDCDNGLGGGEDADIMFTLDASGSMFYDQYGGVVSDDPITVGGDTRSETTKIDLVERGVRQFLDALVDAGGDVNIEVGVLFFDGFDPDDGTLDHPQTQLFGLDTPSNLRSTLGNFRDTVATLTGGGPTPSDGGGISTGTALEPGIEQAQQELDNNGRGVGAVNVVFTDGEPYRGGSLQQSYFDGVEGAADDARSDDPAPATDLYVIGDQTSNADAQDLLESMAGPADSGGGDASYLFELTDSNSIPQLFQQVALLFLPEEAFFEGTLAEALTKLSDGDGIPLDANRITEVRSCYMPEMTQCLGFRWELPAEVGNLVQSDSVAFDLGFYTEQCRNNGASTPISTE
ncbi:vWA domain-containing protein [Haloglomus salinum]|uniref:vWA domain-containing protein n=1 Tax=Haloglomus salinum TaxID=2962673 RepID=UPI0020C9BBDB|nr:VWA domain-containing protein [Haloglomus salinum]